MTFQKIDLYTPEQFAALATKEGDTISLVQPPHSVDKPAEDFIVMKVESFNDAGNDPLSGKALTRVVLTLTDGK